MIYIIILLVLPHFNGNPRILKWRYVSTIFLAKFSGEFSLSQQVSAGRMVAMVGEEWIFMDLHAPLAAGGIGDDSQFAILSGNETQKMIGTSVHYTVH